MATEPASTANATVKTDSKESSAKKNSVLTTAIIKGPVIMESVFVTKDSTGLLANMQIVLIIALRMENATKADATATLVSMDFPANRKCVLLTATEMEDAKMANVSVTKVSKVTPVLNSNVLTTALVMESVSPVNVYASMASLE